MAIGLAYPPTHLFPYSYFNEITGVGSYLEMGGKIRYVLLDQDVQLVHAKSQLGHGRFEHLPHTVVLHDPYQNGKSVFLRHLHQKETNNEGRALAVTNLEFGLNH